MLIDTETLGKRVRMWRADRNMTLLEMAHLLDMGPADLSGMEQGRKGWNLDTARRIEAAIQYSHGPGIAKDWEQDNEPTATVSAARSEGAPPAAGWPDFASLIQDVGKKLQPTARAAGLYYRDLDAMGLRARHDGLFIGARGRLCTDRLLQHVQRLSDGRMVGPLALNGVAQRGFVVPWHVVDAAICEIHGPGIAKDWKGGDL